ncbi:MAG: hypothetical protein AAF518_02485 [Spirochaetota bacterium]
MKYAILLYREQVQRIAKELGLDMTAIEERAREIGWISIEEIEREKVKIRKLAELREKRRERHNSLRTAIRMKQKDCELTFISEMTEIPTVKLVRFFTKLREV